MKSLEISNRATLIYKLLPVLIFFGFGIPLFSMYNSANQWGCTLDLKNRPQCQQVTTKDIQSGTFSSPLTEDEQQSAFYQTRNIWTFLFVIFFAWTLHLSTVFKQVKIESNELIFSNYLRTTRVPFSRVIDARINLFPRGTITIRLMDLSPLGDTVTFAPRSDSVATCRELEHLITMNRPKL
jgi:hypothetical protein